MDGSRSVCLNPRRRCFRRGITPSTLLLLPLLGALGIGTVAADTPRLPLVSEPAATLRFREAAPIKEAPGKAYAENVQEPAPAPAVQPMLRSLVVAPAPSPEVLPPPTEASGAPSELRQPSIALSEIQPWLRQVPSIAGLSRTQRDMSSASSPQPLAQPAKVAPVLVETPVRPQNVSRSVRQNSGRWSLPNDRVRDFPGGSALRTPERRSILSFLRGPGANSSTIYPAAAPASAEAIPMPGQLIAAPAAPGRSIVASSTTDQSDSVANGEAATAKHPSVE